MSNQQQISIFSKTIQSVVVFFFFKSSVTLTSKLSFSDLLFRSFPHDQVKKIFNFAHEKCYLFHPNI